MEVPCSHLGPSQAARDGSVGPLCLLKCEVRRLSTHRHRQELPEWLLTTSFSSKPLGFTNHSFAWPGTPPPSAILDSEGVKRPITEGEAAEGGGPSPQFAPTWPPGLRLPATCGWSLAPVELQLRLPDTTPARRQGISVRLSVGTASVGVVPAQTRASPSPFLRTILPESRLGRGNCVGGSNSLGC